MLYALSINYHKLKFTIYHRTDSGKSKVAQPSRSPPKKFTSIGFPRAYMVPIVNNTLFSLTTYITRSQTLPFQTQTMSDITNSRKLVVWVLLVLGRQNYGGAVPQLDLPQYESSSVKYPQNFVPAPSYSPLNPYDNPQVSVQDNQHGVGKTFRGDVRGLLQALETQASQQCTNNVAAQWNFETNVNQVTQLEAVSDKHFTVKLISEFFFCKLVNF